MEKISVSKALDIMHSLDSVGKPTRFSLAVRSFNKFSKTGGRLLKYNNATLVFLEEKTNAGIYKDIETKNSKNPNHLLNRTKNILLADGSIKKIHIRLMVEFNGKKVHY